MVLIGLVALASLGPGSIADLVAGILFVQPPVAGLAAPVPHADPLLQARLEQVDQTRRGGLRGSVTAALINLQNGASASLEGDRAVPAASLFKVPLLVEILAEEDAGQLDAERRVAIRPTDWTDGSGVLQARVGEQLSIRELSRLMIQDSDNIAALVLLDVVGVARANATAEQLGLRATHVVDHRAGEPGEHTTSAADMARLLLGLVSGQVVNQHVSEDALKLLELQQNVTWLADGLPFWVKVAHKWGDLPQARNDAGVVFTPRGSYVAVVLTQDAPADEAARLIARMSRVGYDALAGP